MGLRLLVLSIGLVSLGCRTARAPEAEQPRQPDSARSGEAHTKPLFIPAPDDSAVEDDPSDELPRTSTAPPPHAAGDEIGVRECDDFMDRYERCVRTNVPEAAIEQLERSLKQMRDSFRQAAAGGPEARAALASSCLQSLETVKTAMSAYGCSWD